jgi:hypothetical protein
MDKPKRDQWEIYQLIPLFSVVNLYRSNIFAYIKTLLLPSYNFKL